VAMDEKAIPETGSLFSLWRPWREAKQGAALHLFFMVPGVSWPCRGTHRAQGSQPGGNYVLIVFNARLQRDTA